MVENAVLYNLIWNCRGNYTGHKNQEEGTIGEVILEVGYNKYSFDLGGKKVILH